MSYLINPTGRFVAIDDPADFERWKTTPGFRVPTAFEESEYVKTKTDAVEKMKNPQSPDDNNGIYLSTVSEGGKDGYGIASKLLLEELKILGVNISRHNTGQKVAIHFHNPYSLGKLEAPYKILYTMFESTKIPDDWASYLKEADEIWVPSKWCAEAFKRAGFTAKVVPLGYDARSFTFQKRPVKRSLNKDFIFLHYNAFNIRKGFLELFKAFTKEFAPDEPVKMVFKTTLEQLPAFPITKSQYPNIDVVQGKASEKELAKLCAEADCFVFPSRGEGFGMTPLEAMATGLPAIVPNAHGISEYFNANYMYEAPVGEESPAVYSRYKGVDTGMMVTCDIDKLAAQMRYIYEHQEEALEKGKLASEYVKNWTFEKTALHIKDILDGVVKKDFSKMPLKNKLNLIAVR